MPHLRLEYSINIKEAIDPNKLFAPLHQILMDTVNADLFSCQSRAHPCEQFYIGEGSQLKAFVHLEILLLEGRDLPKLQELGKKSLQALEHYFSLSKEELDLQISVRVNELKTPLYFKSVSRK